jgi:TPR repeat protein
MNTDGYLKNGKKPNGFALVPRPSGAVVRVAASAIAVIIIAAFAVLLHLKQAQNPTSQAAGLNESSKLAGIVADAQRGDTNAEWQLAVMYSTGDGVKTNYAEAAKWLRKAAEQGDADAQYSLGLNYQQGFGVAQDEAEALKWFRKAAGQHYAAAEYSLGFCYKLGQGVAQDAKEAVTWYRKAAEQGLAEAQEQLGTCYESGNGVPEDKNEAIKWYRKAAEQGDDTAKLFLGQCYFFIGGDYFYGIDTPQDYNEAVKWFRKAADQGNENGQLFLGNCYEDGTGVPEDKSEAIKWYRKAAEQGEGISQCNLAICYDTGNGVPEDKKEAIKWFRKAAEQGFAPAQFNLGIHYVTGNGVIKNDIEAYKWFNLSAAKQGDSSKAAQYRVTLAQTMTPAQIAEAQRLSSEFVPTRSKAAASSDSLSSGVIEIPSASGTGFFITEDGYLISNYHVVKDAAQVRLVTSDGIITAKVVQADSANDLALLKADGHFTALPVIPSRVVKLGGTVATVGFPDPGLQGFAPKLAKGEIAALSGAGDDARYFQISAPVQPGNSGGALVDAAGNVVGIVSAKLDAATALAASGALPENVNYAVKSSFLLSFLESVPGVEAKLKAPNTKDESFEDVVKQAQDAAVLVLVY